MGSRTSYDVIKTNPQSLLSLVNKYVKVQLIKNESVCGFVHAIDPIKHSMILFELSSDKFHATIIPGHAILDVLEELPAPNLKPPIRKTSLHKKVSNDRKQRLISWFKQNLLPVTESGNNILFGSVMILPPYNISDVCTTNPIVAMQVKNIMKSMPDNTEQT